MAKSQYYSINIFNLISLFNNNDCGVCLMKISNETGRFYEFHKEIKCNRHLKCDKQTNLSVFALYIAYSSNSLIYTID